MSLLMLRWFEKYFTTELKEARTEFHGEDIRCNSLDCYEDDRFFSERHPRESGISQ